MTQQTHPFSVLVHNEPGVLSRVAGLLSRRGFNIESLTVGETADPTFSRMTIIVRGSGPDMEQVRKQLGRLVEVVKVADLHDQPRIEMETALIKVAAKPNQWNRILDTAARFGAQVADTGPKEMIVSFVGPGSGLNGLIGGLRPFGIVELARTGRVTMARCRNPGKGAGRGRTNQDLRVPVPGSGTMTTFNNLENGGER
jgi:acetolactate synthase I/III small subunit